jgi:hypothetical protein
VDVEVDEVDEVDGVIVDDVEDDDSGVNLENSDVSGNDDETKIEADEELRWMKISSMNNSRIMSSDELSG